MAANTILLPSIFICFYFFSLTSQDQQNNNHNLLILELHDAKLKISRLESVLEERIQSINAKTLHLKEREEFLEDMANKITYLQSALSNLKDHSSLADERLKALEEEVRCLWAASRKNNFNLYVLESKAQDAEDRLEVVTSQVEKMAEIVTEQWIQIQHLEQALQIAEMRALQAQRQRNMRCTFLKFINDISGRHLPKMFMALDSYSLGEGTIIKYYMSQALQQLRRFYSAIKKYHHEALKLLGREGSRIVLHFQLGILCGQPSLLDLQGFIKQEMQKNEVAAAFVNDELIFFLASAFITFPILGAWMLLLSRFS